MTRGEHAQAAVNLALLLEDARNCLTGTQAGLLRTLQRHHGRLGATRGTCDDCFLGFGLPEPDREIECPACGGHYCTVTDAVGPDGRAVPLKLPDGDG